MRFFFAPQMILFLFNEDDKEIIQYTEERDDMTRKFPDIQNVCYQIPGVACHGKEDGMSIRHDSNLGLND